MCSKLNSRPSEAEKPEFDNRPAFVNEKSLPYLANAIFDWQLVNGMMLKYRDGDFIKARPVSVSLVPTDFPRHMFERAHNLQRAYNDLYAKVSSDDQWLLGILEDTAKEDGFVRALIGIHEEVKKEGFVQDLSLGIFRSDYMLHQEQRNEAFSRNESTLKQVEINTVSCAGSCHATHAAEMHAYMAKTGALTNIDPEISPSSLATNPLIGSLVSSLAFAHAAYGPAKSFQATKTAVLMVVQPFNYNIADERPYEYALWDFSPPVPTFHCIFLPDLLKHTSLTETRELLYHPPFREGLPPVEISVVYLRAACHAEEYNTQGRAARLRLEQSRAIKCPNILAQLAGCKKVQQELLRPGVLERFIEDEDIRRTIQDSFGNMWPLDNTDLGTKAQEIALDPQKAANYVLKPNRDGGGHNIYRTAIPPFLKSIPQSTWGRYILMELFDPPKQEGKLMTAGGFYMGEVVSELGVFGTCLWRTRGGGRGEVLENGGAAGWTFKTKPVHVDEMSVVKGYGCFDCPRLVD